MSVLVRNIHRFHFSNIFTIETGDGIVSSLKSGHSLCEFDFGSGSKVLGFNLLTFNELLTCGKFFKSSSNSLLSDVNFAFLNLSLCLGSRDFSVLNFGFFTHGVNLCGSIFKL